MAPPAAPASSPSVKQTISTACALLPRLSTAGLNVPLFLAASLISFAAPTARPPSLAPISTRPPPMPAVMRPHFLNLRARSDESVGGGVAVVGHIGAVEPVPG